jgi:dGTP triphosphohydrolase
VQWTVRALVEHYLAHPDQVSAVRSDADDVQRVIDYVAGMTDRYCIATFRRLALPEESRL